MWVVLAAVAIHMVGFGSVIPAMPFLLRDLGGDAQTQGLLVSLFAASQLFTSPLWGALSDRIGRGVVASVGLALAASGHVASYLAADLATLAFGRLVAGIGGGTMSALQALLADLAPPQRMASAMATFGVAFGLGFVAGPAVGGLLTSIGPRSPFLGAALLSILASALTATLPNLKGTTGGGLDLKFGIVTAPLLILNMALSMFEGLLSYFAAFAVSMSPAQIGLLLALAGLAAGAGQPIVKKVEKKARPVAGAVFGLGVSAAGLIALAFTLWASYTIYLGVVVTTVGQIVASSFIFALLAERGSSGLKFGVANSAGAMGRIVGPPIGGFLYGHMGPTAPFLAGALLTLVAASLIASMDIVKRASVP